MPKTVIKSWPFLNCKNWVLQKTHYWFPCFFHSCAVKAKPSKRINKDILQNDRQIIIGSNGTLLEWQLFPLRTSFPTSNLDKCCRRCPVQFFRLWTNRPEVISHQALWSNIPVRPPLRMRLFLSPVIPGGARGEHFDHQIRCAVDAIAFDLISDTDNHSVRNKRFWSERNRSTPSLKTW